MVADQTNLETQQPVGDLEKAEVLAVTVDVSSDCSTSLSSETTLAPPAYDFNGAAAALCSSRPVPLPPLPLLNAKGDLALRSEAYMGTFMAIFFTFLCINIYLLVMAIVLTKSSHVSLNPAIIVVWAIVFSLVFFPCMIWLVFFAKFSIFTISPSTRTITFEECVYLPCLRRARNSRKVTWRFGDILACALTVDTGKVPNNNTTRGSRWPYEAQYSFGEPKGAISILDVNGNWHNIVQRPHKGVGGYARLFIALNHYLKATGAMVTIPEHYDCHDFNCNGVLQSIVNDRYVRLMAGHFPA